MAGVTVTGYIQAQYESHQDSEDQLRQGGTTYNLDRFLVRRARLRIEKEWDWTSLLLEFDGNTVRGASARVQKAEASLVWRPDPSRTSDIPYARLTFGLFDVPFGHELVESPRVRPFMERSQASRAFFPAEPDLGVRLSGGLGFFRYAMAIMNGEPLDVKTGFPGTDPNSSKDLVARFGVDTKPVENVTVAGGVSALKGTGFHAGTDATKNAIVWRDLNENGAIDPGEMTSNPATAATPSQNFGRWAVGADVEVGVKTSLGWSRLMGEIVMANNLDRGLFIADPIQTGLDVRELGYVIRLHQEFLRYGLVGFRMDLYDPNADVFEKRAGKLLPSTQRIRAFSPLVGFVLPDKAKLLFQYDIIQDYLARDERGVPTDMKNNQWTLRLQVEP